MLQDRKIFNVENSMENSHETCQWCGYIHCNRDLYTCKEHALYCLYSGSLFWLNINQQRTEAFDQPSEAPQG
jgi:hypothetical protein